MDLSKFFSQLREQRYLLYVPERIYRAHRDRVLDGWGLRRRGYYVHPTNMVEPVLELLAEQRAALKLPYCRPAANCMDDGKDERFVRRWNEYLLPYEKGEACPPFPDSAMTSDETWDTLVGDGCPFASLAQQTAAWGGWVYRVKSYPLWAETAQPFMHAKYYGVEDPTRRAEYEKRLAPYLAKKRMLKEEYGLTSYFDKHRRTRQPALVILKNTYPPEQVRRTRRRLEDTLRHDPAEAIRYGIERGLVK